MNLKRLKVPYKGGFRSRPMGTRPTPFFFQILYYFHRILRKIKKYLYS